MLDQQSLEKRLERCVGVVVGPHKSWDPVNQPMIRHWCDAMGDKNPLYTDTEFSKNAQHGEIVAPPTMIQAWTMVGYTGQAAQGTVGLAPDEDNHYDLLTEGGFKSVVAVNCDQIYLKPLKLGDNIYHTKMLESVSERKQTALGEGYFTTELYCFYNQRDEKVVEMRFRLLRFNPPS
jgi:3-oxo-4,17-pregnadiene-20-carboxyl-CoA hydratase alpha subunit